MTLPSLPNEARVWLFSANRMLTNEEQRGVLASTRAFMSGWTSHGRPVLADAQLDLGRVLTVGALVTEEDLNAGVSGCGIDSLTNAMDDLADELGFNWAGALDIQCFGEDDPLETITRAEFRRRIDQGRLTSESFVLDVTATTLSELRSRGLKRRVADSWHAGLLSTATAPE